MISVIKIRYSFVFLLAMMLVLSACQKSQVDNTVYSNNLILTNKLMPFSFEKVKTLHYRINEGDKPLNDIFIKVDERGQVNEIISSLSEGQLKEHVVKINSGWTKTYRFADNEPYQEQIYLTDDSGRIIKSEFNTQDSRADVIFSYYYDDKGLLTSFESNDQVWKGTFKYQEDGKVTELVFVTDPVSEVTDLNKDKRTVSTVWYFYDDGGQFDKIIQSSDLSSQLGLVLVQQFVPEEMDRHGNWLTFKSETKTLNRFALIKRKKLVNMMGLAKLPIGNDSPIF